MSLAHGEAPETLENRRRFLAGIDIDSRELVTSAQIHSNTVRAVNVADKGRGALDRATAFTDTDAFVTCHRRLPIAVLTADCLPVFLFDPQLPAVGIVHAGWRSTHKRIVSRTVECMRSVFKTDPGSLRVAFGPALRECCYEVSPDMRTSFPETVSERAGRYFFDLAEANKRELVSCGISPEAILDSRLCTHCLSGQFFSYRRDSACSARMISVIMLT